MFLVQRYKERDRSVSALVRKATKYFHLTFIDDEGVKHKTVPVDEVRYFAQLYRKGKPYSVLRAVKQFRNVAKLRGITEAAKAELAAASAEEKEEA